MHSIWALAPLVSLVAAQQIFDVWQTTWDRKQLFTYTNLESSPISFASPSAIGDADIVVNDGTVYQTIAGFGSTLTDSSASVLAAMKSQNSAAYWELLQQLFNSTDGGSGAGFSLLRVPMGASDFSTDLYSYNDIIGDTLLTNLNVNSAPNVLFATIKDIASVNPLIKLYILPWSPPGWMKNTTTMTGGSLDTAYHAIYANYLYKSAQAIAAHTGVTPYAISIQNEPENNNPTYPTTSMPYYQMGPIGMQLRSLLNANGFSSIRVIGYEHNWDHAADYPVSLLDMSDNIAASFAGVAFHCYGGAVANQDLFHAAWPNKEVYFTECSGTLGSDWWTDIKWYMDNLNIGALEHWAMSVGMWNIASDPSGGPELPNSNSCGGAEGCRAVVTISPNGSYELNQEFYAMAHASKASLPKDVGGPFGQRINVTLGGSLNWALRVGAFVTTRKSSTDWNRYSLVVMNWNDNASQSWDPVPVKATIEFRGVQATYTFPVGVTTLWWYAAPRTSATEGRLHDAKVEGRQLVFDDAV